MIANYDKKNLRKELETFFQYKYYGYNNRLLTFLLDDLVAWIEKRYHDNDQHN